MSSSRLRRLAVVLGLAGWIALVPVAAHAAAEPFHLLQPEGGLFAQVWDFVAGLLGLDSAGDSATATTTDGEPSLNTIDNGEQGATVDPNGRT
jgi:hypothetical protein